jgi:hypothetical protein
MIEAGQLGRGPPANADLLSHEAYDALGSALVARGVLPPSGETGAAAMRTAFSA